MSLIMVDFTVYYRPLTLAYPKTIKTKKFIENIVRRSFGIRYNNDENVVISYIRYSNSVMQKWHFRPLTTELSSEMLFDLERSEDELFLKIIRIGEDCAPYSVATAVNEFYKNEILKDDENSFSSLCDKKSWVAFIMNNNQLNPPDILSMSFIEPEYKVGYWWLSKRDFVSVDSF